MEILGTKWPSMTSTWRSDTPARSTAVMDSPRHAKFAARIDGAISMLFNRSAPEESYHGGTGNQTRLGATARYSIRPPHRRRCASRPAAFGRLPCREVSPVEGHTYAAEHVSRRR